MHTCNVITLHPTTYALKGAEFAEYCRAHHSLLHSVVHRDQLTVVEFTVAANSVAANSVSCIFCSLLREMCLKWHLPRQRKRNDWPYSSNISGKRTPAMLTAYSWFAAMANRSCTAFAGGQRSDLNVNNENAFKIPGVNAKARSDPLLSG